LLLGCTRHLTNEEIVGEYFASGDWGTSKLVLRSDGNFQQDILLNGASKHIEGKWTMLDKNALQYIRTIYFEPFLNMWKSEMGKDIPNASFTVESIGLHGIWIDVDADAGTTYKKR
jgi:hypothetical protein